MKGLLLAGGALLLLGGCTAQANADRTVVVSIEYSRFDPGVLNFEAGETVRFIVRNDDPIDHEFLIGDEDAQQAHELGTEEEHGAKPGEITIPAGTTRETVYTFGRPGRLIFGCHIPLHYRYGMRGAIEVS
jgi:uncharacterized cupredoxin-like copper-binding protein